jgi:hypothetical protein
MASFRSGDVVAAVEEGEDGAWADAGQKKADEANGTETGTKAAPFRHFKKAIAALDPGDTLNIAGGVYRQQLDVTQLHGTAEDKVTGTPAHPITIRALPDARVYIDGRLESASSGFETSRRPRGYLRVRSARPTRTNATTSTSRASDFPARS